MTAKIGELSKIAGEAANLREERDDLSK